MQSVIVGRGKNRIVYEHPTNKDWVVKVEITPNNNNLHEWLFWKYIRHTEHAKYFCPCISLDGDELIMMRCGKGISNPKGLWINGIKVKDSRKADNYGLLDNRQVLLDYSHAYKQFICEL